MPPPLPLSLILMASLEPDAFLRSRLGCDGGGGQGFGKGWRTGGEGKGAGEGGGRMEGVGGGGDEEKGETGGGGSAFSAETIVFICACRCQSINQPIKELSVDYGK